MAVDLRLVTPGEITFPCSTTLLTFNDTYVTFLTALGKRLTVDCAEYVYHGPSSVAICANFSFFFFFFF